MPSTACWRQPLTLRGAEVSIGLCDGVLPACQMCEFDLFPDRARFVRRGPQPDLCGYCYRESARASRSLGLSVAPYGEQLTDAERQAAAALAAEVPTADIGHYVWQGVPVGEHALAGALRFYARSQLDREPEAEAILRRYFHAALLVAMATGRLLQRLRPDVVVAHHGIYVPQGIIAAVARQHGIRVVTWNPAYRKQCFIFSHDDTYHHTMMDEPMSAWAERKLGDDETRSIDDYLRSRWHGTNDWIRFHKDPDFALTSDIAQLGLDPAKPVVLALTNVFWDAQLHYPANAFVSQRDWLLCTVAWFARHPALQLVVRVHPAELTGSPASRQFAADEIAAAFPTLPDNVRVIGPDSAASTYHLAQHSNCAIIYATKTGVELASVGIPVIVAGEAWVRNKGFTWDARSEAEYLHLLGQLPFADRLSPELVERARQYAFHFFFRRMIPLEFVQTQKGPRRFRTGIRDIAALQPKASVGLDVICDGILTGSPFHMPETAISVAEAVT
ncbi:MAG: capsule biosynthesis protein [Magnetospirillum sp.]|nr:capsule biosynthesis protein [Magnetospirillum sp.]